jgi:rifampicin phosphotransferase
MTEGNLSPAEAVCLLGLDDEQAADPAVAGGKAAGLARLVAHGVAVPDAVVLPAAALEPFGDGDTEVPEAVRALVTQAIARLGDGPLAVRSSATTEDADDASYAGQYETVLGVRGVDAALEAVRRCVASAATDRVAAYRDGAAGAQMAVLIQRQLDPDAAGVAFTANPVTGARDETLVAAVRGLGDRLASGEANPDEWVVRDDQARCLTCPEGAVDAAQVREVADLARRVEALAGTPQDVEWALTDGQVHLLQARPITALPTPPQIEVPPGPWVKDTGHYTGPMSPLSASAYLPRVDAGIERMLADFGFLIERVHQRVVGWEVYLQPVPPSSDESAGQRIAAAVAALDTDRPGEAVARWHATEREELAGRIEALRTRDLDALDHAELAAHLDACLALLDDGQVVHFGLFVPWLLAAHELVTTCQALLGWDVAGALELVSGLSEASSAPTRDLERLAADVWATPAAAEAVAAWGPGQPATRLLDRLRAVDPPLADRLADHLDRYGCRVPAYDVAEPTFAERPERTLRLLRDLVAAAEDPVVPAAGLARCREDAAARARAQLDAQGASTADRERFEQVLAVAQDRWGLREDNLVLTDTMPNGLLRLAALEIGRRLVAAGRLPRPDDAVWLTDDELRAALGCADVTDLRARVARRRAEQAWVRANPGPPLYGDPPSPPPPEDALPPQAQRVNGAMAWMMGAEFGPPADHHDGTTLRGLPGAPGRVTATARIVRDEADFDRLGVGEVLVCPLTTPAWTVLFVRAAAIVTDLGSPLSHAAIVAREHGLPAVVGAQTATAVIADGQTVTVDGAAGVVTLDDPH